MRLHILKHFTVIVCALLLITSSAFVTAAEKASAFRLYAEKNENIPLATAEAVSSFSESVLGRSADFVETDEGKAVSLHTDGEVTFTFSDIESGQYVIALNYCAVKGSFGLLRFELCVNGEIPFEECRSLKLERRYRYGSPPLDAVGNETPPQPEELFGVSSAAVYDPSGKRLEPFLFSLDAGCTVTIKNINADFYLYSVTLKPYESALSYADYLAENSEIPAGKGSVKIEGESVAEISDSSIGIFCDDSSSDISPAAWNTKVMNIIGGESWQTPGEAAVWEFEIDNSGMYEICVRARQDYTGGLFTNRKLLIDGKLPFAEAIAVRFPYRSGWYDNTIGGEDGAYSFYLEKGKHTLTLECTMGELSAYIEKTQETLELLNSIYRKVFMLTGSEPDSFRDYGIENKMPELAVMLKQSLEQLREIYNNMNDITGVKTTDNVIFDDLIRQISSFSADLECIPAGISSFQSNISALATWVNNRYNQPLDIDYILLAPQGEEIEKSSNGFFNQIAFGFLKFLRSFSSLYSNADKNLKSTEIEVWIPTARDTSEIIRNLIGEKFTAGANIAVKTKMMGGSELSAIVAGRQPDVIIMQTENEPVNYAMRGALYPLDVFSDFEEVCKRFVSVTLKPFKYNDHTYALPESMSVPLLFYRTDIFEELGLSAPKTWDEVCDVIAQLQTRNMQFGGVDFDTLLYQRGGEYYRNNGIASAFDTEEAIEAFGKWTSFFSDYGLPVSYNFLNRFRSGEMPLAIQDYTMANQLEMLAPEISGNWSVLPIPGTVRKDGKVDNTAITNSKSCYILAKSKHHNEAWEFIKWWTSADAQLSFTTRRENRLGTVARVAVSNVEALEQIPWSREVVSALKVQMQNLNAVEQVPGGYFTSRHINNAFRQVVYHGGDVRETVLEYVKYINDEITERRNEFGLPTDQG